MSKRRHPRKKAQRIGAARSWGGAFGPRSRGVGYHNLGRGIRRNAYGERFYVYDAGYILPVPPAPLSPAAAFPFFAEWIEREADKATAYLRKRTGNKRLLPRGMAGALTIERGRLFQPWIPRERSSDFGMLAADLMLTLQGYKSLDQLDDPDDFDEGDLDPDDERPRRRKRKSRATKSGVLGWFIRARTQPIKHPPPKPRKPSKRKPTAADIDEVFGEIKPGDLSRATAKATRKKAARKRAVRSVGRRGNARKNPRSGKRGVGTRARKHTVARGRGVRRKGKR